uniref:CSON007363 protein n=1 Tax=Culicoides sonorensis TaxID=179676 RepID=A0A336LP18_CULSO
MVPVDFVIVNVSNSQNDTISFERKFSKLSKVFELKQMLEIVTGGNAGSMQLELYNGDQLVQALNNDDAILGSYPIKNGMRIHVIDNILFDQNVPKFELTQEQYEKRQDSVKNFLLKNKLGKYNEEELKKLEEEKLERAKLEDTIVKAAKIGTRCKVTTKGKPTRYGTVMYNGELDGKKGIFIGVKFDEPLGTNDGSIENKRYFQCPPKYGGFISPIFVEIGDFAQEEFDLDDEL